MNEVVINNRQYEFPGSWQEIKRRQLLFVAPLLLGTNETLIYRKASALFYFMPQLKKYWLRLPWVQWLVKKLPHLSFTYPILNDAQKYDLLQTVNFLFDDLSGKAILKSFSHHGVTYYLPEDNFKRESIIAFAFADEYFNRYVETGENKYIDLLIAAIARPKGSKLFPAIQFSEGDERELFSTSRTEHRAKEFKDLSDKIKTTVLLFFMGSKKYIHTQYEIMFRRKDNEEDADESETDEPRKKKMKTFGKKKIPKPNFNWIGVIYELSETGVFGNFEQVKNMFLHTCCYYLSKKRYEKEEQSK